MIPPLFSKQEVGIWRVKKRFPLYGVPIWSLWSNIRFLPSIVAEKNATKIRYIQNVCSMCIKINKVGKQKVGIWWVEKRFPRYGVPIWSLWPNIRFLPSTVTEKNATKNILEGWKDRQTDRGKTVYPPPSSGSEGIIINFNYDIDNTQWQESSIIKRNNWSKIRHEADKIRKV
jgi:hypothetical protein